METKGRGKSSARGDAYCCSLVELGGGELNSAVAQSRSK